jgi:polysaccharide deacetylase family protein (PEP-CTERM system associated)
MQRGSPVGRVFRPATAPIVNAMSIDVEDYFQVSAFEHVVARSAWDQIPRRVDRNTRRLLDIFDEFGVRATFFILGWIAERERALVTDIARRGHEVASHGYAHRLIYDQTPEAFRDDVRRAKAILEDVAQCAVQGYRAPSYSITERSHWAPQILAEEGYQYDSSVFPIRHDRYGIPHAPRHPYRLALGGHTLLEVPPSTVKAGPINLPVAGGGYFRLLPYGWTRWGIAHLNAREQRPAIFYLHPWEVDPGQPRLNAGRLSRFRHYRNLHQTEPRLRRLLTDFSFGPVRDIVAQVPATKPVAFATIVPQPVQ